MLELRGGNTPCWEERIGLPWTEYKHLQRDKFEELLDLMMEAHPDHELTRWLMRGFCMNDGDSTISFSSLQGHRVLQWHINHFDEEDAESYELMFGEEEEVEFDW